LPHVQSGGECPLFACVANQGARGAHWGAVQQQGTARAKGGGYLSHTAPGSLPSILHDPQRQCGMNSAHKKGGEPPHFAMCAKWGHSPPLCTRGDLGGCAATGEGKMGGGAGDIPSHAPFARGGQKGGGHSPCAAAAQPPFVHKQGHSTKGGGPSCAALFHTGPFLQSTPSYPIPLRQGQKVSVMREYRVIGKCA
jgi:hypothetical protein